MRRRWRWAAVAALVAVLASLPFAARLLPAGDAGVSAAQLLSRVRASADVPYSGYAQTQGGLALPVSNTAFSDISDLLGGTNQLRVWWRGADRWRIDTLGVTGENDIAQDRRGLWTWNYESNTARRYASASTPIVREPRSDDLVPGNLARRLLSEVDTGQVSRLPTARIAGQSAAGLRVTVTDRRSTIEHIDVWALPDSGLPVQVSVWGSSARPLVTSTLLDLSLDTPSVADASFHPIASAQVEPSDFADIVGAVDHFGSSTPPSTIAGLARRRDLDLGAVGVYGRGVTLIVAVPLPSQFADEVASALSATARAKQDALGISAGIGALNVQLSTASGPSDRIEFGSGNRWLLVGTVTGATLRTAVKQLPTPDFGPRGNH